VSRLDDGDIGHTESDPLLDRLRRALPDYAVERRVAVGGMGVVFRGRDRALDMPVAIKVLRPELATAVGAERFLREARMLAAVNHPSIVTIHKVGETDGLFSFVMEWLNQTLADRLRGGPMQPADVIRMGCELLDGLARVHDRGIIHRDIKPSNIFFVEDGRAKLGDFGIARRDRSVEPPITETGSSHGTPAYMAPEQFVSGDVTPAADLYAMGMVCYETLTGRRWRSGSEPAAEDWRGVSGRLRAVLERALAHEPSERWPDARAFADALGAVQAPRRGWWAAGAAAAVLVALVALFWTPQSPLSAASDVAVLPFAGEGPGPDLGGEVAVSTAANLGYAFSDGGVAVTPMQLTRPWAAQRTDAAAPLPPDGWDDLHTERILRGRLVPVGDSVAVEAELVHRDGRIQPLARVTGPPHPGLLGHRVAFEVVRVLRPERTGAYTGLPGGEDNAAVAALVSAEYAFQRDNWAAAEAFYDRAIALDSSLMLAQWGRYNARRWRRATKPEDVDALERLYERHGDALLGLDRLLIQADIAPTVPERVAIYQSAIALYPYDPYPRSLLGNELFHRGALAGYGLDTAITVLQEAATANPHMASTLANLVWGLTRQGDSAAAASALATHESLTQAQPDTDFCMQCVLQLAWAERFLSAAAAGRERDEVFASPDGLTSIARAVRLGLAFGIPAAQVEVGTQLAELDNPGARTIGFTAQALALLAQGRVTTALDRLEAAGRAAGDPEYAFEANQWRVILPALGVPGVPAADREAGRAALAQAGSGPWGARAHWSLLLDAVARGAPDGDTHADALDTMPGGGGLRALGRALRLAARGDTAGAVALADSLRYHVLARDIEDPLERAVLFLRLGEWLQGTRPEAADAVWRWYENADFLGWPEGHPQAADLDWALETFARYRRARLARASGRSAHACGLLPDAVRRWANADASLQPLRDELSAWHRECVRS